MTLFLKKKNGSLVARLTHQQLKFKNRDLSRVGADNSTDTVGLALNQLPFVFAPSRFTPQYSRRSRTVASVCWQLARILVSYTVGIYFLTPPPYPRFR